MKSNNFVMCPEEICPLIKNMYHIIIIIIISMRSKELIELSLQEMNSLIRKKR